MYADEGNALVQHLSSLDDINASYSQVPSLAEPMEALPMRPAPAAAAAAPPAVPLPAGLEDDTEDMDQSERNIAGRLAWQLLNLLGFYAYGQPHAIPKVS